MEIFFPAKMVTRNERHNWLVNRGLRPITSYSWAANYTQGIYVTPWEAIVWSVRCWQPD